MSKPIVIAIDGSPAADEAMKVGLRLAAAQEATVIFAHFAPVATELLSDLPGHGPTQEVVEEADPVLRAAAEQARKHRVAFELVVYDEHGTNDIAESIVGIAEGRDADLIVVGTRGRGGITGAVLGSVSQRLLHISRLPVVTVHVRQ